MKHLPFSRLTALATCLLLAANALAQMPGKPKLVVGIVVDQMRHEYLYRYADNYGENGLMRLLNGGFSCDNTHYNYVPTNTAPGHASVYTGTTPAVHGIINNGWYDKASGNMTYCASDTAVRPVGTPNPAASMSPRKLMTTTICDELRLHTLQRSKTIGISLKDRGAILPAGHTGSAAYWFDGATGNWVTSSYYMRSLPGWAQQHNDGRLADMYIERTWAPSLPLGKLSHSIADSNAFEAPFVMERSPAFPHNLPELAATNGGYDILKCSPFGNSLTTAFAISAINGERLGTDDYPDFLAVSYSATDVIGHRYAPDSKEVEDAYIRLDKELERLLAHLDNTVGKDNYLVFLTADHGAVSNPNYLRSLGVPAGYISPMALTQGLNEALSQQFGAGAWIANLSNEQVFLDHALLARKKVNARDLEAAIVAYLMRQPNIANAIAARDLMIGSFTDGPLQLLKAGYNQKRSGDVMFILQPGVLTYGPTGSSHGSPYNYDTHVPLLWYGNGIAAGQSSQRYHITDIAPTLSRLLEIPRPSGATGNPIPEVVGN